MQYYLAIKRSEIPSFVMTWMKLEDIMSTEISQTCTTCFSSYVEIKKVDLNVKQCYLRVEKLRGGRVNKQRLDFIRVHHMHALKYHIKAF
jgi:hypothetical protein